MTITSSIRYRLDPFETDSFRPYPQAWDERIPRCRGEPLGHWMPRERPNDEARRRNSFASLAGLAGYEACRRRQKRDRQRIANCEFAQRGRSILGESRTFRDAVTESHLRAAPVPGASA